MEKDENEIKVMTRMKHLIGCAIYEFLCICSKVFNFMFNFFMELEVDSEIVFCRCQEMVV